MDTTGATTYWYSQNEYCTSSHCHLFMVGGNSDSGVASVKFCANNETTCPELSQTLDYPLPLPTANTPQTVRYDTQLYTLQASGTTTTTTNADASFGSITLPVKSNVCVHSNWVLQVNTNPVYAETAYLKVDGTAYNVYSDVYPFTTSGIGTNVASNYCISNLAAGSHTFAVHIDQYPWQSGEQIQLIGGTSGSFMWVTAYPTQ